MKNMIDFIQGISSARAAVVSISSAFYAQFVVPPSTAVDMPNTNSSWDLIWGSVWRDISLDCALQRLAWTVAIVAGMVAICNGTKSWRKMVKGKTT